MEAARRRKVFNIVRYNVLLVIPGSFKVIDPPVPLGKKPDECAFAACIFFS